ncbi:MAG TPA: class I SAM-dependent methyltransferase [Cyclobacteriaceae bacterium]|nr:class I SAM-dependent methyltransferase [Cyclobacteriaceae bacterium]
MELSVAIGLIEKGVDHARQQQTWADLGAGNGLFTKALTSIIKLGTVIAVDRDKLNLSAISAKPSVKVKQVEKDFTDKDFSIEPCDGLLMANSLHYVSDKVSLIRQLKQSLAESGVMIIIEYERSKPNAWVPYPIRFQDLQKLFIDTGFASVEKMGEVASVFDRSTIYSALIRQ